MNCLCTHAYNTNNGAIAISVAAILMASFNSLTAFEVEPLSNNDNLPGNNSKASPVSMLVVYVSFQLNTNENKNTTKIVEIDNLIAT